MDGQTFKIVGIIGLACSVIASLMAYVIAMNEYSHHFAEKRDAVKHSVQTASITFIFFAVLTMVVAIVFRYTL